MKRGICKLCVKESDLRQSHFLGKAFYKLLSADGSRPILLSPNLIIQDEKQIQDYLLCGDCEQRFNKLGEHCVAQMVNRPEGFRMLELIRANGDRRVEGAYSLYSARHMALDTDKLAYFALSVLWRGTHIWHTFDGRATGGLDLESHAERLRRYLLGIDPYPTGTVVKVSTALDGESQLTAHFPYLNPEQKDAKVYTFRTLGLWFDIAIGESLPAYMYDNCCVNSPEKPIFVGDFSKFVRFEIEEFERTARITSNLQ